MWLEKKPGGTAPAPARHTRLGGDIGESSVAIVVIQDVFSVARDIQIRVAIIIVVADGHAHTIVSVTGIGQARLLGHIREGAIAILPEKPIPIPGIVTLEVVRRLHWTRKMSAIDEKDVEQSIIVIVKKRNSTGHGFD